jgi:RNA polymerase sigma-70 factor (ECF subfamily)
VANYLQATMEEAKMQTEGIPDLELLNRARAGEAACYGALVARHHRRLYRAAHKILRNEADAEDAIQQAYLHSFRHLDQFQGRSAVVTWLTSIAINESFTFIRRRVPYDSLDAPGPAAGDRNLVDFLAAPVRDPEQQAITRDMGNRIRTAIAALPDEYSAVFRLREIEGLPTEEAAARLGITKNCLKTRLFRARNLLRTYLCNRWGWAGVKDAYAAR